MWWIANLILIGGIWLVYAFLIWRKFRLDNGEREILQFCIWSGVGFFGLGLWLGIWVGLVALLATVWYFAKKFRWDGFEMLDFILPLAVFGFTLGSLQGFMILSVVLGVWVNFRYRKFRWYKSGKPGLGGLSVLMVVGIVLIAKGFVIPGKQYAGLQIDQVAGVWLLTGSLVSVYLRSRLKLIK